MLNVGEIYRLKNNQKARLVAIYPDYFSKKDFVLLKINESYSIADLLEFQANIVMDVVISKAKRTTSEKVQLYRSYFRGRENMIATSFENNSGKRVYYPLCLSRKKYSCPKIKKLNFPCTKCQFQNFQPILNEQIIDHLRGFDRDGREVFYGIYPLTEGNTVYFLAFDFDKKDWQQSGLAFVKAAKKLDLSPLIELSQSGNGCHIWFFFAEAIQAKLVRQFGFGLLKYAMLDQPKLTFDSYDRMFPNQDELSYGGFGNLIALPLQGSKVKNGTSRFIDEHFNLIEDIWGTLEATPKLEKKQIERIIKEIDYVLPTEYYQKTYEQSKISYKELSLFTDSENKFPVSFMNKINVVVCNQLEIKRNELTKEELLQLKFLATFHNKAFYVAQNKRQSTRGIPRFICLAKITDSAVYLPRGLEPQVRNLFSNASFVYQTEMGKRININFKGSLYPKQEKALTDLMLRSMGILCAGTGFGKTVVAAKLIAEKKVSTLVLVHNKNLANQWRASLENFLEIEDTPFEEQTPTGRRRKKSKIGKIYGGTINRSNLVDIGLFQSLAKQQNLEELFKDYGMIIVDEAHHVAAKTFEDVIKKAASQYIYGLTATPNRDDGLENILYMRLGEIRHIAEKEVPTHVIQKLYMRFTSVGEQLPTVQQQSIHENYQMIMESEERTKQVILDILENLQQNRHIIVLTRFIKHLTLLEQQLKKRIQDCRLYILNGQMKTKELRKELLLLKKEGKPFVLLTTMNYAGEGFDLPALDTLFLAMPISSHNNLKQYLGRLLRNLEGKEELRVYDYVDYAIPMIYKMHQKRLRTYKKLGYELWENKQSELYKSNLFNKEN
ncbi:DEAD/DEAH box helicase [Enterococcus sp. 5B3_DIV0040]|uniref:DEAD/DEAH box helicase n=1 Tax=Enterococcus sp. 5B3_DIV0040 TaxID=1834182 RepID=UPI000A353CE2|nr:DEAD/DEAH box helicase [Enterococcus sp. 5B3_DIV0040]OTO05325.1 hypothetical protein A5883_002317 [Enterococcus sp. 5B3_DIV0040]